MLHKQTFDLYGPTQVLGKAWRKGGHTGFQDPLIITLPPGDNPLIRWGLSAKACVLKSKVCFIDWQKRQHLRTCQKCRISCLTITCIVSRSSGDLHAHQSLRSTARDDFLRADSKESASQNMLIMALEPMADWMCPRPKCVHTVILKTCECDLILEKESLQM